MPYSPERHLVSSVVMNSDFTTAVARGVTLEMFRDVPEHWAWIANYVGRYAKCPSRVAFQAQFPTYRVAQLDDTAHYADEVRREHARHLFVTGMNEAADFLTDGDMETALKKMHGLLITAGAVVGLSNDGDIFADFEDIYQDAASRAQRVAQFGAAGITSGIKTIDDDLGGFNPGELCIVAARLGEGKSWVMQNSAVAAAVAGKVVQFDALEQSRSQVGFRIHSLLGGALGKTLYKTTELMQGKTPSMSGYRRFLEDMATQMKGKLHVSDASRGRVSSLTIASQIERNKPDIVFVDYLGLMSRGADWQGMAQLTGELKQIAVQYGVPIVAASQLNRENGLGKEPPGAEALSLSDAIGQDADLVLTMKKTSARTLKMRKAKCRNGASGDMWYMQFEPDRGVIREVTANKALDMIDEDRQNAIEAASA